MTNDTVTTSRLDNIAYNERRLLNREIKLQIGREIAKHIPDNTSIFINIGTTTQAVAEMLMQHKGLRIVTNDLGVATTMSTNSDFEVIIAGGIVRSIDDGVVGEATIDLVRGFYLDYAVIGISGIDTSGALLDYDYREVRVAQSIIDHADKVFLAADSSKFGRRPVVRVGHISQIDAIFTDKEPTSQFMEMLKENKVKIHIARQD